MKQTVKKEIDFNYFNNEFPALRDQWLEKVSRTFTLSIRILPPELRAYVGHAYLICRLLDTLEDTPDILVKEKKNALDIAIDSINSVEAHDKNASYFSSLADNYTIKEEEKELLRNSSKIFDCLLTFPENVQKILRKWTVEMAIGMKKYAFGKDKPEVQLQGMENFEEYTYFVAGTVGELLTDLYSQKRYGIADKNLKIMRENSIQFGKALQFVNIIKDSRADIEEGRCFIPKDLLDKYNCDLTTFFNPENIDSSQKVYTELIMKAKEYLDNAIEYINNIPIKDWRIRLFCIWPVVLAYKTLLEIENRIPELITNPSSVKISRAEVKSSIKFSAIGGFSKLYFNYYIKKLKER